MPRAARSIKWWVIFNGVALTIPLGAYLWWRQQQGSGNAAGVADSEADSFGLPFLSLIVIVTLVMILGNAMFVIARSRAARRGHQRAK